MFSNMVCFFFQTLTQTQAVSSSFRILTFWSTVARVLINSTQVILYNDVYCVREITQIADALVKGQMYW